LKPSEEKTMVKKVNSSPKIMVRFSEIGIKSAKTRKWLTRRLIRHIEYILKLLGVKNFQVINKYSRIFILTTENINLIGKGLSRLVPGIASLSFVYQTTSNIKEIKNTVKTIFLKEIGGKNSFAVKTKRIGTHSYSSVELSAEIGEYILNNMDKKIHVNLENPEYTLFIEVRESDAYIFDKVIQGLGGLPAGSQGGILMLIDGDEKELGLVLELFKRGVNTFIVSTRPIKEIPKNIQEAFQKLLKLQMFLPQEKRRIISLEPFDISKVRNFYTENKCLGIAISEQIFEKYLAKIPVNIPLFVPDLVIDINSNAAKKALELIKLER